MGSRVELFEKIRRDHDREDLSIHELARRHRVHRRTVRQALASPLPPPRKPPEVRPAPALGPSHPLIDGWLEADRAAPPKQRHTARRIWERLTSEHGAQVGERTVREYVARRRRELGLGVEAHVPQAHDPGAEAEVDWGEAKVWVGGELVKAKLFLLRLSHSGATYVEAFPGETQQAFLEAHANAFCFLGGVPGRVRYDNLRSAVQRVMRGRRRVEARIGARRIEIVGDGKVIASHERVRGRYQVRAALAHYAAVLTRKPGALAGSLALAQEREHGGWPACFDSLWRAIEERTTPSEAARQMVDVLLLCEELGPERVELAVRGGDRRRGPRRPRGGAARPPFGARPDRARHRAGGGDRPGDGGRARPRPIRRDARGRELMAAPAKQQALEALVEAHAVELRLPTVRKRFRELAREATREQQTPVAYLAALLEAEVAERAERRERRRLIDARFPLMKRLEEFRFADNPQVPQATIAALAEGGWIDDRETVILSGESGTGKTHLAIALGICACEQGRRVRFTTLAALANELTEAESRRELARVVGRYSRYELLVLDELGYLALPAGAAELVFQVISERNERASLIVTTNLPFAEWTKVLPDARLAKAVIDRLTHRAHIIETGTESWRFRHGLARRKARGKR